MIDASKAGVGDNPFSAVANLLRPVVGDFVTRTSISMAIKRIGKTPETLIMGDLKPLAEALRPALRNLIGSVSADELLGQILALRG